MIAWGVAECGIVFLLFFSVLWERMKAEKVLGLRSKSDKMAFQALGVWLAACIGSAIVGILRGNPWDYLLGDFYRFASIPFLFAALYFAMKDSEDIHKLLRGFILLYGVMVVLDLVRFNSLVNSEAERLTTEAAHQAGMIAVGVIYSMLFDPSLWMRRCCVAILLLTTVLVFRAQMLNPLLTSLLAMALFFMFSRKLTVLAGAALAAVFLVVASFYSMNVSQQVPSYIAEKVERASDIEGPLESLQSVSGSRLGEIISIGEEFVDHPMSLLFGTGAGSLVNPDPLFTAGLPMDQFTKEKHYVHSGLFDALFHNGAIATGALIVFLLQLFRRAARLRSNGKSFGLFALIAIMIIVLMLAYDLPMESAIPFLALCFSGVSILECAPQRGFRTMRATSPIAITARTDASAY